MLNNKAQADERLQSRGGQNTKGLSKRANKGKEIKIIVINN